MALENHFLGNTDFLLLTIPRKVGFPTRRFSENPISRNGDSKKSITNQVVGGVTELFFRLILVIFFLKNLIWEISLEKTIW